MIIAINWRVRYIVAAVMLEVILTDLINEPLTPVTDIEVWRHDHPCEWMFMPDVRREVGPVLSDA